MTIENIVKRQVEFQKTMYSTERVMYLAFLDELGEYVASMGYADWKKTARDEANMDIELIDMAVFAINLAYYSDTLDTNIGSITTGLNESQLVQELVSLLASKDYRSIYYTIFKYKPILIKVIVAKQALNQLRQDYGYKLGEYEKNWCGQEDNVFLMPMYGMPYEKIYCNLEEIYTNKVIPSSILDVY